MDAGRLPGSQGRRRRRSLDVIRVMLADHGLHLRGEAPETLQRRRDMPILTGIQRRNYRVGQIKAGDKDDLGGGKIRPHRLDGFRFVTPAQSAAAEVADVLPGRRAAPVGPASGRSTPRSGRSPSRCRPATS